MRVCGWNWVAAGALADDGSRTSTPHETRVCWDWQQGLECLPASVSPPKRARQHDVRDVYPRDCYAGARGAQLSNNPASAFHRVLASALVPLASSGGGGPKSGRCDAAGSTNTKRNTPVRRQVARPATEAKSPSPAALRGEQTVVPASAPAVHQLCSVDASQLLCCAQALDAETRPQEPRAGGGGVGPAD